MSERDRRALILLAVAVVGILLFYFTSGQPTVKVVEASVNDVAAAERRLTRLREMKAAVPGREQVLETVKKELATREQGLLQAETAAQAQAQLLQILRRVSGEQPQPIQIRNFEPGQVRPLGEDYGEAIASVSMDCRPEQLVNLLADLTKQKELVSTSEIRVGLANRTEKTMPVRLTVSAVVPRKLVPVRKGGDTF
ncbi:MAG TPA: type II secretion system protein GspM [Bryobacteraceae bacterium]|nr:type II secretion system protein GspM [Bryobacteraceae bacterium]